MKMYTGRTLTDELIFLTEEQLFKRLLEKFDELIGHYLQNTKIFQNEKNIYQLGDRPKGIYYLISGKVKVTQIGINGREVILRIATPNQFIGYLSLLNSDYYTTSATCLEESEIYFVPKSVFLKSIKTDVLFANGVIHMLCEKLSYSSDEVTDLVTKNVRERISTVLLTLDHAINDNAGKVNGEVRLKKKDIASLVGTVPETLSRNLCTMENEGLLRVDEKSIQLIDRGKLVRISQLGD